MLKGGCFCGQVQYLADAPPLHATLCHCTDCRRIAGAPAVAWFTIAAGCFQFVTGAPKYLRSSPMVQRAFCANCGTHLTYQRDDLRDEIDVTTCSLDDPSLVPPLNHTQSKTKLPWMHFNDDLPELPTFRQ